MALQIETNNIVETLLQAGRESATKMQYENFTPFMIIPNDHKVETFDYLREFPIRIEQTVTLTTADAFADYINRYGDQTTIIFVDGINNKFTAILDYHERAAPGWKKHIARFEPTQTPEWQSWLKSNEKTMTQEDFGRFIENNLGEIQEPTGAEMLEIALSIQASTDVKFSRATRLDNGQLQIAYTEVTNGTAGHNGQLKIPEKFTIGLRLFRGAEPYKIEARLRYRIKEGNLTLWYELIRPQAVIDANIEDITAKIKASIGETQIFYGIAG